MEAYTNVLLDCPLFRGVAEADLAPLLRCLGGAAKPFSKGRAIFTAGADATHAGVVLRGIVQVCREDAEGQRTVLTAIGPGGLFGEAYACAHAHSLPVSVWAQAESVILLLDIGKVTTLCSSACAFHQTLVRNLLGVLAQKNIFLTEKMEHLAKRTLREKLLSYLRSQETETGRPFTIPFDRQALADYLCADRSALSRELGRLRDECLVDCHKNQFRLL